MKFALVGGGNGLSSIIGAFVSPLVLVHPFDTSGDTGSIREIYNVPAMGDARRAFRI
jgi:hypothetical protein